MARKNTPRTRAFSILKAVLVDHHALDTRDEEPWIKALCFGVLRQKSTLDYLLNRLLKKPLTDIVNDLHLVLLMGAYQLLFMDTKAHAALFETVELAKALHLPDGLVNGVLRNIQRQKDTLLENIPESVTFNHPAWLLTLIQSGYPQDWKSIVQANNLHPPFFIRVNTRKIQREAYLDLLKEAGIQAAPSTLAAEGLYLPESVDVQKLPHFQDGFVSVQDLAAQLTPHLLQPQPGERILDACAAPGGKACHLLEQSDIKLYCVDHKESRGLQIQNNLQRLGLTADIIIGDSSMLQFEPAFFDRSLVDAPCSGTGVIRRHPDIRYLKSEADIPALARMQQAILTNLWLALKPGGTLLYATCSILPEENDDVIHTFLQTHPDSKTEKMTFGEGRPTQHGWQFLPSQNGPDGFYYCLLVKLGYNAQNSKTHRKILCLT